MRTATIYVWLVSNLTGLGIAMWLFGEARRDIAALGRNGNGRRIWACANRRRYALNAAVFTLFLSAGLWASLGGGGPATRLLLVTAAILLSVNMYLDQHDYRRMLR